MPRKRYLARHVVVSLLFGVIYLLLNQPEVVLLSRIGFVAWYPATGLTMAFMVGLSPWYAVVAHVSSVIASRGIYGQPVLSFTNTVGTAGIVLGYGLAAFFLRNYLHIDLGLRRRRDVVHYAWTSATAAFIATIFGVGCLLADHSIGWHEATQSALGWLLGDGIALIGIAPFLLVHVMPHVRRWLLPPDAQAKVDKSETLLTLGGVTEACAQGLTILLVLWLMFGSTVGRYDHFYLCIIPIIWIAMRQGIRRVVSGLLCLNFGIVVAMQLFPPTAAQYNKVALLMLVQSGVGLIVGSEVSERHRLAIHLNEKTSYLDSLIQNSPLGILVLDPQGQITLANSAFERLFQCSSLDLSLNNIKIAGLADAAGTDAQVIAQIIAGETFHRTVRQTLKDGSVLDLAVHAVPLHVDGAVRGAYLIYQDVSEQIKASEDQTRHAESLDRLVKELELRTRQMSCLNEMGSLLECSGTVAEAAAVVGESMPKLFPENHSGALYLFRSSRNLIETAARWGDNTPSQAAFNPDACWSLRRGQPHWTERPGSGISCLHLKESSARPALCIPMVAQGNTIGILQLEFDPPAPAQDKSAHESLRSSRERVALAAASQIALSLASLQLRGTLREQSIRDPLTRLFNRRFMEESLERELQLAARSSQPLTVLFLDLDHFKRFNDTFGHEAGDMVLQSLSDLFRSFFRATDICCRYGGEEFAIILPESSAKDAAIRAEAFREEVKRLRLRYKKQTLGPVTVSIGVAAFPEHGSSSEQLLAVADRSLYESKSRGRDTVTVATHQQL